MENTILEILGENYKGTLLEDDSTEYGGVSFHGETLGDFMEEHDIDETYNFFRLNNILKACGIKELSSNLNVLNTLMSNRIKQVFTNYEDTNLIFMIGLGKKYYEFNVSIGEVEL